MYGTTPGDSIPANTVWLTLLLVLGFAVVMWRNHRRVTRINRELQKANEALHAEKEALTANRKIRDALEKRVSRAERMESLGTLASNIAHDFNNLLVGVVCNAQLLKQHQLSDEARERCLDGILVAAEKSTELAQHMRAYAGREPLQRRAVDIVSLVKRVKPLLHSTFSSYVDVCYEFESESLLANVDEGQVETILISLARNARDAIGQSPGQVAIRVGSEVVLNIADESNLFGRRTNGGEFITLELQDSGAGLKQDDMDRIFEPFFTTKDDARGMDLAVVYGLVNRCDGLIRCRSTPGEGTTMTILLPRADKSVPDPVPSVVERKEMPPQSTLAVIDDETSILSAVSQAFEAHHWNALTFSSAKQALARIAKDSDRISCILLDVVMPEMNADVIVTKLHELGLTIPIVIMSGCSSTNLTDFVSMPNVKSTLNKPFSVEELIGAVNAATLSPDHSTVLQTS